ncbi:ribosome biogenesis regulatory protein (RRS1),putative [Trypanosoma brucei gambiense DAL972]|uniref:Ribosome biogenesis regulatory protein n=2 Tax=Trypanosoma brucei TaxID=5691 RepID=C9ZQM1_TRYB9|nr:ribosome biogenesis regulatory protein (RRS1),putative [Trypanosoma brucei gambiense DAL972]RHW72047.1 ribosome biogenesis regulatory protein (RRS1) [Trypanosoma brucei equiperdum]CBH11701.1 ribosome biogenesis regulatory protein (RRS1),putative [Trypanosoma brucei gambiense DAL972]|eukprot:XP_011773986.1 ribosome biogenesis regulatory protein (RRS1),putative [Trypanosoma brucei gambiense DAL972]
MSEYHMDLGLLCVTNSSLISGPQRSEGDLHHSTLEAMKVLLKECCELPTATKRGKFDGSTTLLKLPQPVMQLPREKAPPKPKPPTAWEKFAMKKGIALNRKKTNRVFDEERQVWKDKWGKRAREEKEKYDWLREVGPNYVPQEEGGDPFLDERRVKKERLEKQKKKEEHNKRRSEHISRAQEEVKHLTAAAKHLATASNGKFDKVSLRKKGKK